MSKKILIIAMAALLVPMGLVIKDAESVVNGSITNGAQATPKISNTTVTLTLSSGVSGSYSVDNSATTSRVTMHTCATAGSREYALDSDGSNTLGLLKQPSGSCAGVAADTATAGSNPTGGTWSAAMATTDGY